MASDDANLTNNCKFLFVYLFFFHIELVFLSNLNICFYELWDYVLDGKPCPVYMC